MLLFKEHRGASGTYEERGLRFEFNLVRMWEIEGRELVEEGDVRLLPFVPLTRCGREDVLKAEERIYNSELERSVKSDLLTALAIFAGLKDEELMMELFKRRRDIMIESPAYELIKREGFEEGVREGMERGLEIGAERGKLEEAREMVLEALSFKFGLLPEELVRQVKSIREREVLKGLLREAIAANSLDEFKQRLGKVLWTPDERALREPVETPSEWIPENLRGGERRRGDRRGRA